MVGGDQEACDRARDLMLCYSKQVELMGGAGAGQHTMCAE